ncbi:hypothetical protein LEP1GSC047_0479 [Leptospira inadai serovar Lyme str. 10]|uniref:Uncharacterized protein n=1 Tax=Leptospira inadai serovar Lyme str. 10 TaxID=1049790 RepID=V6HBD2_9LEPT|nr:hypothetical protein LEP1GSC047_0479 [Leptospira inadai serovar Lyme str. 10]
MKDMSSLGRNDRINHFVFSKPSGLGSIFRETNRGNRE